MNAHYYQSGAVTLHHGNCLDVLAELPDNSVDAVVTDPPYGLANTTPEKIAETVTRWVNGERDYLPGGTGFMGNPWDAFVPPTAVWDDCLRVLKPGGHVLAFAGSRTVDLMGLSLRMAGFDIRDSIAWLYGSGFPKSLDVSKAIDKEAARKAADTEARYADAFKVTRWLRAQLHARGVTSGAVNAHFGASNIAQAWLMVEMGKVKRPRVPRWDQWEELRRWLDLPADMDGEVWRLNGNKGQLAPLAFVREAKVYKESHGFARVGLAHGAQKSHTATAQVEELGYSTGPGDVPATPDAERWQGWGTALKPAFEPVVVARKPLRGTVGANVLEHGTGALNIDGCRRGERWPANVILDEHQAEHLAESRFFYVAKAGRGERPNVGGIAHPTVKPLTLMRWLVRLVTPPGGTVLEPFAGSGTTVEACILEGFRCVAIEREADYLPLIEARIARALAADTDLFGGAA